jgi:putative membrane protein
MGNSGYPGLDGFLGTRAPLILDVLCLAMLAVLAVLGWSIYLAKCQQRYELHKSIQITLGVVLLVVVALFELDIRLHGWQDRAAGEVGGHASTQALTALYVHLVFAVSTVLLWIATIVLAFRRFTKPPMPGPHSQTHKRLAWLSTLDMVLTTVTGWIFYVVAFVL